MFASAGFSGNPLAVVHDAEGIGTDEMLQITEWANLSETTFLLAPTDDAADYRVRIFCPGRELPFAGHPTLGTCQAWLAAGGRPKQSDVVVQECGVGLVRVRRDGDRLAFAAPPLIRSGPVAADVLAERLAQLNLASADVADAAWIDNGPGWIGLLLGSAAAVLEVLAPTGRLPGFDVGLVGPYPAGSECAIEVRAFFSAAGGQVREDPVTGSLNASVAQWLIGNGRLATSYVASQGTALGRRGRVHVDQRDGAVWIGGAATVVIEGTIEA